MKKSPLSPAERKRKQRANQAAALRWYTKQHFGSVMSLEAMATAITKLYERHERRQARLAQVQANA